MGQRRSILQTDAAPPRWGSEIEGRRSRRERVFAPLLAQLPKRGHGEDEKGCRETDRYEARHRDSIATASRYSTAHRQIEWSRGRLAAPWRMWDRRAHATRCAPPRGARSLRFPPPIAQSLRCRDGHPSRPATNPKASRVAPGFRADRSNRCRQQHVDQLISLYRVPITS